MEAAEILEKAADKLESGEWAWNQYSAPGTGHTDGGVCALQALYRISNYPLSNKEEYAEVVNALHAVIPPTMDSAYVTFSDPRGNGYRIARWNDLLAKNVHEVVDKMKEAAKNLRNSQ